MAPCAGRWCPRSTNMSRRSISARACSASSSIRASRPSTSPTRARASTRTICPSLSTPFFVLFAVFAVSMVVCVWRWFTEPDANELLAVVAMWNLFNLMMSGAALGVVSERRTVRDAARPARAPGASDRAIRAGARARCLLWRLQRVSARRPVRNPRFASAPTPCSTSSSSAPAKAAQSLPVIVSMFRREADGPARSASPSAS